MPEERLTPGYNATQETGRRKDENTKIQKEGIRPV